MKHIDISASTMKLAMDQLRGIGAQLYNKRHSGVHTSATVANQIKSRDWDNSYAPTSQIRTQSAQTTNKRSAVICTGSLYLNGNFAGLPEVSKWILSLGMILGRLELFAILVLFLPSFWRN